jgi:hypothetical protein
LPLRPPPLPSPAAPSATHPLLPLGVPNTTALSLKQRADPEDSDLPSYSLFGCPATGRTGHRFSGYLRCARRLPPTRRPAPTSSAVPATASAPPASTPVRASEPPPVCVPGPGGTLPPPGGVFAGEPVGDGLDVPQVGHRGVVGLGDALDEELELVDGDGDPLTCDGLTDGLELGVPHS